MPRKKLSQKILEAIELSEQLNRLLNTLSPEIREIVLRYMQRRPARRRRRVKVMGRRRRRAKEVMGQ
ncbi:MAG: hypothetical protein QW470_01735 [Candidatus Caldarchaeum sp.]